MSRFSVTYFILRLFNVLTNHQLVHGLSFRVINRFRMLASAVLQCLSVLGFMFTGSCETSLKVTQLPESASGIKGTNVSFHCSIPFFQDGPRVNLYWWKQGDNKYLSIGPDDRKVNGSKTKFSGFLQIINVSVEDSGVYYCTVDHRGKIVGNGTGSNLAIWVPPTPLKIVSQEPEKDSAASLTLLCTTSPFYPQNISFTWYKDGTKITTRINNTNQPNTDGLYEASSRLEETQAVQSGTVYTCLVSHSTLEISATATHIVQNTNTGGEIIHYLLIRASAGGGLVVLVLAVIIGKQCVSKKNKGAQNDGERSDYREQPGPAEVMAPYATLDLTKSRKGPRPKHQERTVYAQTKQRGPDNKLTYAALDMTGSKKTANPNFKDKSTEYAQLQMKNQRADVILTEGKAK